jgi:hypothetical protein
MAAGELGMLLRWWGGGGGIQAPSCPLISGISGGEPGVSFLFSGGSAMRRVRSWWEQT